MTTSFRIEHDFLKVPLEKFVAHLNDPKLNEMLEKGLDVDERKLLKRVDLPDVIEWQFSIKKSGEVPAVIEKVLKGTSISWIEDSTFQKKDNCIHWRISPQSPVLNFKGEGVYKLSAHKGGTRRVIEGTVTVNVPLIGKIIESFITAQMKKSYEIEPDIQNKFYASIK